jgi:hypothetical protein
MPQRKTNPSGKYQRAIASGRSEDFLDMNKNRRVPRGDRYNTAVVISGGSSSDASSSNHETDDDDDDDDSQDSESGEEDVSGSESSGSSYESNSDEAESEEEEDELDGAESEEEVDGEEAEEVEELITFETYPIIGGWLDFTCGWLDRRTSCMNILSGNCKGASLLQESKLKGLPNLRRIENLVRYNVTISAEDKRNKRLERKGLLEVTKTEDGETVVTASPRPKDKVARKKHTPSWKNRIRNMKSTDTASTGSSTGSPRRRRPRYPKINRKKKDQDLDLASSKTGATEQDKDSGRATAGVVLQPFVYPVVYDRTQSVKQLDSPSPFGSQGPTDAEAHYKQIKAEKANTVASEQQETDKDGSLRFIRSVKSKDHSERRSSRSTRSSIIPKKTIDASEREELTDRDVPSMTPPNSPKRRDLSKNNAESEDIVFNTSVADSKENEEKKLKKEEESNSLRSERASVSERSSNNNSLRSERVPVRSERSSTQSEKSSVTNERVSTEDAPQIIDLAGPDIEDGAKELPTGPSSMKSPNSPQKNTDKDQNRSPDDERKNDTQVFVVLELDKQDSWTPGSGSSLHSNRSRTSLELEASVLPSLSSMLEDDPASRATRLWQEEEEKLENSSGERQYDHPVKDRLEKRRGEDSEIVLKDEFPGFATRASLLWDEEEGKPENERSDHLGDQENGPKTIRALAAEAEYGELQQNRGKDANGKMKHSQEKTERKSSEPTSHEVVNQVYQNLENSKSHEQKDRLEIKESTSRGSRQLSPEPLKSRRKHDALWPRQMEEDGAVKEIKSSDSRRKTVAQYRAAFGKPRVTRRPLDSIHHDKRSTRSMSIEHSKWALESKNEDLAETQPNTPVGETYKSNDRVEGQKHPSPVSSSRKLLNESLGLHTFRSRDLLDPFLGDHENAIRLSTSSRSRDLRETKDGMDYGVRKSKSHDLRLPTNNVRNNEVREKDVRQSRSRDLREPKIESDFGLRKSRIRDLREPNDGIDRSVLKSKSEIRDSGLHQSKSRDLQEIASLIPEHGGRPSKSRDMRESNNDVSDNGLPKSKSRDLRESNNGVIQEIGVRKSTIRDLREQQPNNEAVEEPAPAPVRKPKQLNNGVSEDYDPVRKSTIHDLREQQPNNEVYEDYGPAPVRKSKSRDLRELDYMVHEDDIQKSKSRESKRFSTNEDRDEKASKGEKGEKGEKREKRLSKQRGMDGGSASKTKYLRRLERKLEKQLKNIKREKEGHEQEPDFDEHVTTTSRELRLIEIQLVRKLKKDEEKRASKLRRLREKPESLSRHAPGDNVPKSISEKVHSRIESNSIPHKVADLQLEQSNDAHVKAMRSSKPMQKYYTQASNRFDRSSGPGLSHTQQYAQD